MEAEGVRHADEVLHDGGHQPGGALLGEGTAEDAQVLQELLRAAVRVLLRVAAVHGVDVVGNVHQHRGAARVVHDLAVALQRPVHQPQVLADAVLHDHHHDAVRLHMERLCCGDALGDGLHLRAPHPRHELGVHPAELGGVGEAGGGGCHAAQVLRQDDARLHQRRRHGGVRLHEGVAVAVAPNPRPELHAGGHVQPQLLQRVCDPVGVILEEVLAVHLGEGGLGVLVELEGGVQDGELVVLQAVDDLVQHRGLGLAHLVRPPQRLHLTLQLRLQAALEGGVEAGIVDVHEEVVHAAERVHHHPPARLRGVRRPHRRVRQLVQQALELGGGDARLLEVGEDVEEGAVGEAHLLALVEVVGALHAHAVAGVLLDGVEDGAHQVEVAHHLQQQPGLHVLDEPHQLRVQPRVVRLPELLEAVHEGVGVHHDGVAVVLHHHHLQRRDELRVQLQHDLPQPVLEVLLGSALGVDSVTGHVLEALPDGFPLGLRDLGAVSVLHAEDVQHLVACGGDLRVEHVDVKLAQGRHHVAEKAQAVLGGQDNLGALLVRGVVKHEVDSVLLLEQSLARAACSAAHLLVGCFREFDVHVNQVSVGQRHGYLTSCTTARCSRVQVDRA
mmetsp:Transcript_14040/g.30000  ORF Transcript_14040/g.30000 Transcript_14040/m.30000 type:complete len:614 (+) Transcript_14040:1481-3322(+)